MSRFVLLRGSSKNSERAALAAALRQPVSSRAEALRIEGKYNFQFSLFTFPVDVFGLLAGLLTFWRPGSLFATKIFVSQLSLSFTESILLFIAPH